MLALVILSFEGNLSLSFLTPAPPDPPNLSSNRGEEEIPPLKPELLTDKQENKKRSRPGQGRGPGHGGGHQGATHVWAPLGQLG